MTHEPYIFQFSERSILVRFDEDINENLLKFLLQLRNDLLDDKPKQILQVINTYNSLLIIYVSTIRKFYKTKNGLLSLIERVNVAHQEETNLKKIPVCYHHDFGWDLEFLSTELELSVSEIIERHSAEIYTVYFIGFLPGFPYLGGLNSSLFHKRKSEPRPKIPAGSVGIADQQTGIYPTDSPGGWQIIGRSPLPLFDPSNSQQLSYLQAGDKVQFESISKEEFEYIQSHSEEKNW